MLDFALADGDIGEQKKNVLNLYAEVFDIDGDFFEASYNIISIKNTIY